VPDAHVSITEFTVPSGDKWELSLNIDGASLTVPIDQALFRQYRNHFAKKSPTAKHRKELATLLRLMRAAYLKGYQDGKK
jgi:hypothetical protein